MYDFVSYTKGLANWLIRILMCWDGEVREIGFVDVGRQEKWRAMR